MKQINEITIEVTHAGFDDIAQILNLLTIKYKPYSGLFDCDIVFINCASSYNIDKFKLRAFVEKGGIVYASDWASRVISEAFPDIMRFTTSPDDIGIVQARVVDNDLKQHIGSHVNVNFDLPTWNIVSEIISGEVLLEDSKTHQPLMVKSRIGKGFLYYTSFHNHGLTTENEEKLLQLLILKQIGELNSQNIQQTANSNGIDLMNLQYKDASTAPLPKVVDTPKLDSKKGIITSESFPKAESKSLRGKGLNCTTETEMPKLRIGGNLNTDE